MTSEPKNSPWKSMIRFGLLFGVLVFVACAYSMIQNIGKSTSSTAAIGFIFVPFWAFLFSIPAFVVGLCVGFIKVNPPSGPARSRIATLAAAVIAIGITAFFGYETYTGIVISKKVQKIQIQNAAEMPSILEDQRWGHNKFVLGAIAQNPQTSTAVLHQIAQIQDPELHKAMGSLFFDLLGTNRKGLAVMRLVADHANVSIDTLELLATSPDPFVLGDVARNEKISEATLRRIASQGGQLIDWGVAANKMAPPDLLTGLAKSTDEYTRGNVASNPRTLASDLALLSRDKESHVRSRVAMNPSTPKEILLVLAKDPDPSVQRTAADRLAAAPR